ncbi:MAG: zinc ribbon domain-containing protein [candidate division WOR-3 bacterium]
MKKNGIYICPRCGFSTVDKHERFCPSCKTRLIDSCPHCGSSIRHPMAQFCPVCGKKYIAKKK